VDVDALGFQHQLDGLSDCAIILDQQCAWQSAQFAAPGGSEKNKVTETLTAGG
jgi:hypothetical protein